MSHRVVIVGGGFGGLNAARLLGAAPVDVTLIDRRNFHLFQPLLYQIATGGLSPGDISAPLRTVLKWHRNTRVLMAEVVDIDVVAGSVLLEDGERVDYDTLVVAAGSTHHYFGHDDWAEHAPGLKTIEDATRIRSHILRSFECAERSVDAAERDALLTFVIVGGGPTGVELAGAIGELAGQTLRHEFRRFDPSDASRIVLVESYERLLPSYPPILAAKAQRSLERLGVEVKTRTLVAGVDGRRVTLREGDQESTVPAATVLWAAGVQASALGRVLAERAGAELDRAGRVEVAPDLSLPGHPEILVVGDLAVCGQPLPGTAPVAMQQGRYVARLVRARLAGKSEPPFRYRHKGSLAVIGRAAAVADLGRWRFSGYPAWLLWLFVHIMYLVGFEHRLLVFIQWAHGYFTRKRGARLITGPARD